MHLKVSPILLLGPIELGDHFLTADPKTGAEKPNPSVPGLHSLEDAADPVLAGLAITEEM